MSETVACIHRLRNLLLVGFFFSALWLPSFDNLFQLDDSPKVAENRRLAAFPKFEYNRATIAEYPARFEQFYRDRSGYRNFLIRWHHLFHVKMLQTSPVSHVVLGQEGWLFLGKGYTYEYYRSKRRLTPEELQRWRQILEGRRNWLADRGIRYLFVVVPNKETIYSEFMPSSINRIHQESIRDQLIAYMRTHSDVPILDLRAVLHPAKGTSLLYSRTDSHWNDWGAFLGYQEILKQLSSWFPRLHASPLSDFELRPIDPPNRFDLSANLSIPDWIPDKYLALIPRVPRRAPQTATARIQSFSATIPDPTLPRAVMLNDSFAWALAPFLSEHFQRSNYVFGQNAFPYDIIAQEQPDVVIQEVAERFLVLRPTNPPEVQDRYLLQHYEQASDVRLAIAAQQQNGLKANVPLSVGPANDTLLLRASLPHPQLTLPPFSVSPGTIPVCRIDLTSPAPTTLSLFYLTNKTRAYTAKLHIPRELRAGRQQVYIPLTDREFSGALRLDFGTVAGEYHIHGIEVRAFSPENITAAAIPPITPETQRSRSAVGEQPHADLLGSVQVIPPQTRR